MLATPSAARVRCLVARSCRAVAQQKRTVAQSAASPSIAGGKLGQIIRDSIKATGPMPLSRYMQFCLSHPTEGYYQKGDVFGRKGDFITSPEISQIFGELLAVWLMTRWMAVGDADRDVRLVELGPGRGTLMDDVLRTLSSFPAMAGRIKAVHLVENSARMRDIQGTKLEKRVENGVKLEWYGHIDEVPQRDDQFTMLIAHEFFDAMPINLFEKRETGYREVLVDTDPSYAPGLSTSPSSGLRFALSPEPTALSTVLPATSARFANLPLGSRIEVAQDSWKMARRCGELIGAGGGAGLVVDYGGDRAFGDSFRAFRNHKIVNVFDTPGSADLTANVDFAYLREAMQGKARGLGPLSQMQFLMALGLQTRLSKLIDNAPNDDRRQDLQQAVKRLIDPLGMGTQYQVMGVAPLGQADGEPEVFYPFA